MIIRDLMAQQQALAAEGKIYHVMDFEPRPLGFVIELALDGSVIGVTKFDHKKQKSDNSDNPQGMRRNYIMAPVTERSSGIKPGLLYDYADYSLGIPVQRKSKSNYKPDERHKAFVEQVLDIQAFVAKRGENYPELDAVVLFYQNHIEAFKISDECAPIVQSAAKSKIPELIFFSVGGRHVVHVPGLQEHLVHDVLSEKEIVVGQCCVTGKVGPLGHLHGFVKGVAGTKQSGAKLVSFNQGNYNSFGRKDEANAPMSVDVCRGYHRGLNYMLSDYERHHIRAYETDFLIWGDNGLVVDMVNPSRRSNDDIDTIRALVEGHDVGGSPSLLRTSPDATFHFLALSGSDARIAVTTYEKRTAQRFLDDARRWFDDMSLQQPFGGSPYFPLWKLAGCTARHSKDKDARLYEALTRAALLGEAIPDWVLDKAIYAFMRTMRTHDTDYKKGTTTTNPAFIRAEIVTLAKLALARKNHSPRKYSMSIDHTNRSVPYLLGRLYATAEALQRSAVGLSIGSGISSRIQGFVSAPNNEHGPLLVKASKHLNALRGKGIRYSRMINEITDLITPGTIPHTFTRAEQGEFMIGYHQQEQYIYTKKSDPDVDQSDNNVAA